MAKTYAAFYLPPEEKEVKLPDQKNVDRTANSLSGTLKNLSEIKSLVDVKEMARNIDLQSTTEFTQRYAVGALTKIINGEAVTNKTMLDSLFNTYAPALNAGLAQTGFNSLVEMKNAAQAGNGKINVANFVQGFSNGLSIVQSVAEKSNYSKYGEEIPIDVITQYIGTYNRTLAEQKIKEKVDLEKYIGILDPVEMEVHGHVKNEHAEIWRINDFSHKITDCMMKERAIIFRVGKGIYEDCLITSYKPTIINIYDISFVVKLKYNYYLNMQSVTNNKNGININPNPNNQKLKNKLAKEVYGGIIK